MGLRLIDRAHALAFRQRATHLHTRLPRGRLIDAAFAGLQDSSPRSALLALHARVRDVSPSAWEDRRFVQVWGPRGAVYVVPREDVAVFTLGLLPRDSVGQSAVKTATERAKKAFQEKKRLAQTLQDRYGPDPPRLRTASISGAVRIRWDGSRTEWWIVDPPTDNPESARLELARRFLRSLASCTPEEFAWWSGVSLSDARQTFRTIEKELLEIKLEGRKSWILSDDQAALKRAEPLAVARLLPPGDPYIGAGDRKLMLPEAGFRSQLWPKSDVWPGALLVYGEIVGTWRRQIGRVTIRAWRRISSEVKEVVETEVDAMPIESIKKEVRWVSP